MKLYIILFFLGTIASSPALGQDNYVNKFSFFYDFDKYLSESSSLYEIILNGNAEYYDDDKYTSVPRTDKKGEYKGVPEFVITKGRLFHRGKLICDIKNGYPVPVNEVRPDNLTKMQQDMTICIYLPFVYYKKENTNKKDLYGQPNYSIRVILQTNFGAAFKYKNKMYYRKKNLIGDDDGREVATPLKFMEDKKKCKEKLFADEQFEKSYNEVVSCGLKKDLKCLKKYLPVHKDEDYKLAYARAKELYGEVNGETDTDLMYMANLRNRVYDPQSKKTLSLYRDFIGKPNLKELHRKFLVDNLNRLFKIIPHSAFYCTIRGDYMLFKLMFEDQVYEELVFRKTNTTPFEFEYDTFQPYVSNFRD